MFSRKYEKQVRQLGKKLNNLGKQVDHSIAYSKGIMSKGATSIKIWIKMIGDFTVEQSPELRLTS